VHYKIQIFWDVMPCQLSKNCQTLKMEAPHCYETLVTISRHIMTSQKIWRFINTQPSNATRLAPTTRSRIEWSRARKRRSQWWTPQGGPHCLGHIVTARSIV